MTFAPRKRGRPPGTSKVHPDRDRIAHYMVEWVMQQTGLPLGQGEADPADHNACVVAAWLMSAGAFHADYMVQDPNRDWLIESMRVNAHLLEEKLRLSADLASLRRQLRAMNASAMRDAYRRVQSGQPWRPSVREDIRRAEHTRAILGGAARAADEFLLDDDS